MEVIHKINITAAARVDVHESLNLEAFDWRTLKREVEEYITYQTKASRLPWWGYFRADYIDEKSGGRLKLFFYKCDQISIMQFWDLVGVCAAEDWTEEADADGQIRAWLETKTMDVPDEDDWVVRARVHEILKNTEKTLWVNVLEEVKNAFECERDKEAAQEVALLQSAYFSFSGRRAHKKDKRHRKSDCNP